MIKKNEESGKKISSFRKFTDLNKNFNDKEDSSTPVEPINDDNIPGNPNLPNTSSKLEKPASTEYMMPQNDDVSEKSKVKFYGKIAKLPKGTKASKGFNFLENVKVSKSSIWYIMVEKQDNELQMVKYNHKKGVDLNRFITDLKVYYSEKYSDNPKMIKLIENINIDGNDKYSWIKNIPLIDVDGKKMISRITEDLIKLLSK